MGLTRNILVKLQIYQMPILQMVMRKLLYRCLPIILMGASGKVNINTADGPTLETLPRVGPAMAARIIDWRTTNGNFASIDDLKNVTGIGDKTFEGLKDLGDGVEPRSAAGRPARRRVARYRGNYRFPRRGGRGGGGGVVGRGNTRGDGPDAPQRVARHCRPRRGRCGAVLHRGGRAGAPSRQPAALVAAAQQTSRQVTALSRRSPKRCSPAAATSRPHSRR